MTKTVVSIEVLDAEKRRVPSKHYVYVINVKWSDNSSMVVYRRYSRFFDLQTQLLDKFPVDAGCTDPAQRIIPFLPGKIFFGRSHIRDVAMKRLGEIDAYCKSLLNLPSHISQCEEVLAFFEVEADDLDPPKEDHKHKSAGERKAEKISGPKQLEQYSVIADYEAQEKGEISLQAGVSVEVVEKSESGWWFVNAEEQQGWVPSTYLQALHGQYGNQSSAPYAKEGEEESFICIEKYEAVASDEITLEKGVIVEVLQKNMDGWWLVRYQGSEGMAPATYLRKRNDPHAINLVEKSRKSGVQIISNLAAVSTLMTSSSSPRNSGILSDSPRNSSASVASAACSRNSSVKDRISLAVDGDGDGGQDDDEWEDEVQDRLERDVGPKGDSYTKVLFKQRSLERGGSLKPPPRQNSVVQLKGRPPPSPTSKPVSSYVTVADFEDTVGDGISFGVGESVSVLEKTSSGWWFVRRGQDEGWVPESYLEPAGNAEAQTNSESAAKPSAASPKPPEKKIAKPPTLPSKPVEKSFCPASRETDSEDIHKGSQVSGIASALKSKFESKPPHLPGKSPGRPSHNPPPPPPAKQQATASDNREMDGVNGAGVAGLASVLKSRFEAGQQRDSKPVVPASKPSNPTPASKPTPPSKVIGTGATHGPPPPPQKPAAVSAKPAPPFKKPGGGPTVNVFGSRAGSAVTNKPQPPPAISKPQMPSSPPKLPASAPKQPSGPPKLPSGPPKLPSKPPGHKPSSDSSSKSTSDIPPSSNKVSNMAAAFSHMGVGQNISGPKGGGSKPLLPGKKPQPPAQKPLIEGTGGQNRPKVGNLVSELSGKLQFGADGGGGNNSGGKFRSPEPSPVSKTGPWSGTQSSEIAHNSKPVAVFPGMAVKPSAPITISGSRTSAPSSTRSSVQYEVLVDFDAANEGEASLVFGDLVEVLEKQEEWCLVRSQGVEGWAPTSYLQCKSGGCFIPIAPSEGEMVHRTICAFEAQSEGEVGFEEGEEVNVLEETDTGWWRIEVNGQEGWAPADYITSDTW